MTGTTTDPSIIVNGITPFEGNPALGYLKGFNDEVYINERHTAITICLPDHNPPSLDTAISVHFKGIHEEQRAAFIETHGSEGIEARDARVNSVDIITNTRLDHTEIINVHDYDGCDGMYIVQVHTSLPMMDDIVSAIFQKLQLEYHSAMQEIYPLDELED